MIPESQVSIPVFPMKYLLTIYVLSLSLLVSGCNSSEHAAESGMEMSVAAASYQDWSGPTPVPDEGMERGTDLRIVLDGWPEGQSANFVVFRRKRSFPARIVEQKGGQVEIHARIIHESGILAEVSETVDHSDRLVFTRPDGQTGYIEIEKWEWAD